MGMNVPMDISIIVIEESDEQENAIVLSSKKTFDPSNSLGKWVECLCDPLDGNNAKAEHFHQFTCQNVRTIIG